MRQGVRLEPLLQAISDFLDDQQDIIERVRRDLVRGLRKPRRGRRGLTPQQVLRSFVLKRVKNWDYRELRERIADGMTLRQLTEFHCHALKYPSGALHDLLSNTNERPVYVALALLPLP